MGGGFFSILSPMSVSVFFGCASLILLEFTDEIADILEPAVQTDAEDGTGGFGKKRTGMFDPAGNQILHGRCSCDLPEKTAQILRIAGDEICQVLQCYGAGIVLFHIRNQTFVSHNFQFVSGRKILV